MCDSDEFQSPVCSTKFVEPRGCCGLETALTARPAVPSVAMCVLVTCFIGKSNPVSHPRTLAVVQF
jgi:hypothetical protein